MATEYLINGKLHTLVKEGTLEGERYRTFYNETYHNFLDIFEHEENCYEIEILEGVE